VHGMLSCPFPLHKLFAVLDHGMKLLDLAFGHSIPGLRVSSNNINDIPKKTPQKHFEGFPHCLSSN
jgi:hypothetical protein